MMDKEKLLMIRQLNAIRDQLDIVLMGLLGEEDMDEGENNCKECGTALRDVTAIGGPQKSMCPRCGAKYPSES